MFLEKCLMIAFQINKDGHNKGQKQYEPNRSRGIKKRWQEYTEELYKKDLDDLDNYSDDLEPEILECEVKWTLGSITTNKASGGDGIPVELFQILKDDAVKVLQSIYQQIWLGFPHSSVGKDSACSAGDLSSMPGLGRSPGEGNGNPFQYSCLENPMNRGAWQVTVHGVARVGHNLPTKLPPAAVTGLEKVSFHSNLKKGQCQRMFKLLHNCTNFTCQQSNTHNPSS